jgi:hypothetical protein
MSRNLWLLVVVLGWAVFLAGCDSKKSADAGGGAAATTEKGAGAQAPAVTGGGAAAAVSAVPKQPDPPSSMMDLLPEGTVAVVYIPSLKTAEAAMQRIVTAAAGAEEAADVNFATLVKKPGLEAADLDLSRGGAVAVVLSKEPGPPGATAIIPVRDEKAAAAKVKAKNPEATVETGGGWAAITKEGAYKRAGIPANLRAPLPAGDVIVRVDMAALVKAFGPMAFEQADAMVAKLKEAPGAESAATMAASAIDGLKSAIDATTVCDIALRANGTAVEVDVMLTFSDSSKAGSLQMFGRSDLARLASGLQDGAMVDIAASVDFAKAWPALSGLFESSLKIYPEKERAVFTKMFDRVGGLMKSMGKGMAETMSFGAGGMAVTAAFETPDAAAHLKAMSDIYSTLDLKDTFIQISPVEDRTVDGTKVKSWKMTMDIDKLPGQGEIAQVKAVMEMMLGKGGLAFSAADLGNRVLFVMGGDDALKRALAASKAGTPSALSKALAAAGSDTAVYVRIDFAAMMGMVASMMKGQPGAQEMAPPSGDPVNLTMILNASPSQARFRLSADVEKFVKLFKGMKPK